MAVDINGDGLIALGGTSTTQGRLRLAEDTDNGTNYVELTAPASVASNLTLTLPSADGTSGQALTTNGSGVLAFATVGGSSNVQTFNTSGTWTKPAIGNFALVQLWGGGAGGNRLSGTSSASGGGGGGYNERFIPLASLGSTETVTVGAGGAGRTGSAGNGTNGGRSDFGGLVYATGGVNGGDGAYPGSIAIKSKIGTVEEFRVLEGIDGTASTGVRGSGMATGGGSDQYGWWNGGSGTATNLTSPSSERGGGGGGRATSTSNSTGGGSIYAGAGGDGGRVTSGIDGTAPAGGGGSRNNNLDGGNGAAGRVIVYVW